MRCPVSCVDRSLESKKDIVGQFLRGHQEAGKVFQRDRWPYGHNQVSSQIVPRSTEPAPSDRVTEQLTVIGRSKGVWPAWMSALCRDLRP